MRNLTGNNLSKGKVTGNDLKVGEVTGSDLNRRDFTVNVFSIGEYIEKILK